MIFNEGDRVCFTKYTTEEYQVVLTGTVTSVFYEPGDPVQGINVTDDWGHPHGGLDAGNVSPIDHLIARIDEANSHNRNWKYGNAAEPDGDDDTDQFYDDWEYWDYWDEY